MFSSQNFNKTPTKSGQKIAGDLKYIFKLPYKRKYYSLVSRMKN